MKKFINKHPRLYWFVVVGLAVLAFGIITAVGCAKLEKAEAAEQTLTVNWKGEEVYLPLGNYPYYCIVKDAGGSGSDFVFLSFDKIVARQDGAYSCFSLVDEVGNVCQTGDTMRVYGYKSSVSDFMQSYSDGYSYALGKSFPSSSCVISNYDICNGATGAVVYEAYLSERYSETAPYVSFIEVSDKHTLRDSALSYWQYVAMKDDEENNPNRYSSWTYKGVVANLVNVSDYEKLALEVSFEVELPQYGYLTNFVDENYTLLVSDMWDGRVRDAVREFDKDNSIPRYTYRFTYMPDLTVYEDGSFTYTLDYEYMLNSLFYFNSDLLETYGGATDSDISMQNYLMAFSKVVSTTTLVFYDAGDVTYYGRPVINYYSRDRSDAITAEVMVDIFNASAGEIEEAISDAIDKGYGDALNDSQQAVEDLQNRLDEVESTLNTQNGILDGFNVDFDGNALWGAIRSVGSGLIGISSFLVSFAGVIGSFFVFLPYDMQQIIGYMVIAFLAVLLWRLLRKG